MSTQPLQWPFEASQYETICKIGRGAFSNVFSAICRINSEKVAIKIMDLENISTCFEDILQEVQIMRLCLHENVLKCYCSFVESDQLWLVTQFMDKGSAHRVLSVARAQGFGEGMNEDWLAYVLLSTLRGLDYLHEKGHIHRDIKCGNILLDSEGNVRLADFGVSGWTIMHGMRSDTVRTFVGTPAWMAPEIMEQSGGYDNKADIWSIGITALELAKGKAPYGHFPPMKVLVMTIEDDPPSLRSYDDEKQRTGEPFSVAFEDFYRKCLNKNSKCRPTTSELLKHKFLRGRTKDSIVAQLLNHVASVASEENHDLQVDRSNFPETSASDLFPVSSSIASSQTTANIDADAELSETVSKGIKLSRGNVLNNDETIESSGKYVAGTTWVFDVDKSSSIVSENNDIEKIMDEFEDLVDDEA